MTNSPWFFREKTEVEIPQIISVILNFSSGLFFCLSFFCSHPKYRNNQGDDRLPSPCSPWFPFLKFPSLIRLYPSYPKHQRSLFEVELLLFRSCRRYRLFRTWKIVTLHLVLETHLLVIASEPRVSETGVPVSCYRSEPLIDPNADEIDPPFGLRDPKLSEIRSAFRLGDRSLGLRGPSQAKRSEADHSPVTSEAK